MRLRLKLDFAPGYNGPSGHWTPGVEREVEDGEARRLLRDFSDRFEAVAAAAGGAAPNAAAPPARRLMKPARGIEK